MTRPEPLPDTWYSRDLLVLREVARAFGDDPTTTRVDVRAVATALDMDEAAVAAIGETLIDAGFAEGRGTDWGLAFFSKVTAAGRREVGQWPSPDTAADRLMAALEAAVANAPTEEAKSRAKRILEGFRSASRDFIVDVASGVVTGQISGG
ncbi:hypothetical protein [Blastococcus sp. TF02A-35]|uniref:hypothetical protein n=1 Tax=Blastococcus sp. TF02A-35 TaxID=2559612 RepID=UPI0010740EE8|nr:hypothetical protein [Blastococcus sp. TF02A_35]TFV49535.1 hypothetical protein E4P43_11850 [Blastococcus sp. TF02A_35]